MSGAEDQGNEKELETGKNRIEALGDGHLRHRHDAAVTAQGFTEVGTLRGSRGDQNYSLPPGLDLSHSYAVTL